MFCDFATAKPTLQIWCHCEFLHPEKTGLNQKETRANAGSLCVPVTPKARTARGEVLRSVFPVGTPPACKAVYRNQVGRLVPKLLVSIRVTKNVSPYSTDAKFLSRRLYRRSNLPVVQETAMLPPSNSKYVTARSVLCDEAVS